MNSSLTDPPSMVQQIGTKYSNFGNFTEEINENDEIETPNDRVQL
jgi:hypothetical protein